MSDYSDYFKHKKITVMGLGLLGRGIGVTKFLSECGADLIVTDLKTKEQLAPALDILKKELGEKKFNEIKFVLGEHRLEDFRNRDFVIRAPNAALDSIYLAEARKNNVPIKMDASLFVELAPFDVEVIGVTGTRGKSTVTQLIYEILRAAGKPVILAGNVQGTATLPRLATMKPGDRVVLELDSWQLQGFDEARMSPQIAVFTSFFPDHMNYYKADMARYWYDKASIFRYQKAGDLLVVSAQVMAEMQAMKEARIPDAIASVDSVLEWRNRMRGDHNKSNVALALEVARALHIPDALTQKVVENFAGLPGRQEIIAEEKGVTYVNDTNGTSPDAVIAALHSFSNYKHKIILICGGFDKGLEYAEMGKDVAKYCKAVVVFRGTASPKILSSLEIQNSKLKIVSEVSSMHNAVEEAKNLSIAGDLVLLSPGVASFGMFTNEYDRGNQFNTEVQKLHE